MSNTLLIIPFYNEADRILLDKFESIFAQYKQIDFLLIDDGSRDKTLSMLCQLAKDKPHVFVKENKQNLGKAETIRKGILNFELIPYDYLGYLDADLATPVSELVKLLRYIKKNSQYKIVMGSRVKLLGNAVKRSLTRHYLGRIFATIVSQLILKIPVYDTQCGAKIIEKNLAEELFKEPFLTKWLFDVELLLRFKKRDGDFAQKIREIPLEEWTEKGNTKIKVFDFLAVPFQLIKLMVYNEK